MMEPNPQPVDSLINARWVIPVEPDGVVLEHHGVAVRDGRIVDLLPAAEAARRYQPRERLDLDRHALIPGLINGHTHSAMSLFRGLADDLPLMEWLAGHIWPAEQAWVGRDFVRDGVGLALAEMIRGGTTCFNDMYFFPDQVARVAVEAGIRTVQGLIVVDFPTPWAKDADEYFRKGEAVHDEFRSEPLVDTAFAPHAPYTVADAALERVAMLAEELDIPIHMHIHETAHEVQEAVDKTGQRPLARLKGLGLLSPRLIAVHMTALSDAEIGLVAEHGVHVAHCPESNLKLATGLCPAEALRRAGINLALGTDGAASNNDLDMLGEMRSAALLAKGVARDARALPAHAVLRMATLNGARALGLEERIGSLEAGKAADMAAVDLGALETQPVYDPVSQIVYAAGRSQVSHVWVAGRPLLADRDLLTLDAAEILARSSEWQRRIANQT